jgi:carbon monoxide dehydrogenase subunit G
VSARVAGAVALRDIDPGRACTIAGEGKGGAAGFAKGQARVTLEPAEGGTLLRYEVEASVGGKLAQLGSRIIDGFARKLADEFFERFQSAVEGPAEEATEAAPEGDGTPPKGWFRRMISRKG